jgi:hypothetical protein
MRLQHAKQAASGLSTDTIGQIQAKAAIVAEVERLHWRIWNGKARNARRTLERVRTVMHVFRGELCHRAKAVPSSRKLWHALRQVDKYLRSQSARLVNYAERYRVGLRVGTSVTEGHSQLLGQSPDEQAATDAMVTTRRRLAAAGSMCGLKQCARTRLQPSI